MWVSEMVMAAVFSPNTNSFEVFEKFELVISCRKDDVQDADLESGDFKK